MAHLSVGNVVRVKWGHGGAGTEGFPRPYTRVHSWSTYCVPGAVPRAGETVVDCPPRQRQLPSLTLGHSNVIGLGEGGAGLPRLVEHDS